MQKDFLCFPFLFACLFCLSVFSFPDRQIHAVSDPWIRRDPGRQDSADPLLWVATLYCINMQVTRKGHYLNESILFLSEVSDLQLEACLMKLNEVE